MPRSCSPHDHGCTSLRESLTKFGTSHEVVAGLLGVFARHVAGHRVELGEHVSVEAVVVLHEAEGRRAVWHVVGLFPVHHLGLNSVVEDLVSCGGKGHAILHLNLDKSL